MRRTAKELTGPEEIRRKRIRHKVRKGATTFKDIEKIADEEDMKKNLWKFLPGLLLFRILNAAEPVAGGDRYFYVIRWSSRDRLEGLYPADNKSSGPVYRFSYDKKGRPVKIVYQKKLNILKDPFLGVKTVNISYDGNRRDYFFSDPYGLPVSDSRGIYSIRFIADPETKTLLKLNYDSGGQVIPDRDGVSVYKMTLDRNQRKIREIFLNDREKKIPNIRGIYEYRYKYDSAGNMVEKSYYDKNGNIMSVNNVAFKSWKWTPEKGKAEEAQWDSDYRPVSNDKGVAVTKFKWDSFGNLLRQSNFDAAGKKTKDNNNVSVYEWTYDKDNNKTALVNRDENNNIIEDSSRVARYKWEYYEQGNEVEQFNYNIKDQPAPDDRGMFSYRWSYNDKGKLLRSISYGENDKIKTDMWGGGVYTWNYDIKGRVIEARRFASYGVPAPDVNGAVAKRWDYDKGDRILAEYSYGSNGQLLSSEVGKERKKRSTVWNVRLNE